MDDNARMFDFLIDPFGQIQWLPVSILVFALVFLIVGLTRIVEFNGLGLSVIRRRIFMVLHVIGCLFFTSAFVLGAVNLHQDERKWMFGCFVAAMVFLAPGQFFAGLARKKLILEAIEREKNNKVS